MTFFMKDQVQKIPNYSGTGVNKPDSVLYNVITLLTMLATVTILFVIAVMIQPEGIQ